MMVEHAAAKTVKNPVSLGAYLINSRLFVGVRGTFTP